MHWLYIALSLSLLMAMCAAPGDAQTPAPKSYVLLETSQGDITLELDPAKAPITVENFLKYVDAGHYDDTVFHRVIPGFMIQGGGYAAAGGREKPTRAPIKNESRNGLSNAVGTIAMARTNNPDSATAQFFINVADNSALDTSGGGYCVFGKVVKGMEAVSAITKVRLARNEMGEQAKPVEPVILKKASRVQQP